MKAVYHDLDRSAPVVKWQGVRFIDGVPTDVPGHFKIKPGNPFFEIVDDIDASVAVEISPLPESAKARIEKLANEHVKQTLHLPSKPKG
jgi:hypothetical protein